VQRRRRATIIVVVSWLLAAGAGAGAGAWPGRSVLGWEEKEEKGSTKAAWVMQEAAGFWEAAPLPGYVSFVGGGGTEPGALSETTLIRPRVIGRPQAE
jgi:hypothetical protein